MRREALLEKSALRIFEQSAHNGVSSGEVGLICSRHGVGKTACVVHLSVDKILQEKHVIHVSLSDTAEHIVRWYKNTCHSLSSNTEEAETIHREITQNRVILHLSQRTDPNHIFTTIEALINKANFDVDIVIIDGYDLVLNKHEQFLETLRSFAQTTEVAVWLSNSFHREDVPDNMNIPHSVAEVIGFFDVVLLLEPQNDSVHLNLLKDHNVFPDDPLKLKLDSASLLIKEE